ncbi:MAG: asparagine synthase-related protein [Candidatus Nitrosotenuis sp.]
MQEIHGRIRTILHDAISSCTAQHLALSGGLDSTILAYFLRERKPNCIVIISKDHTANDLTYCQMAAQQFDLPLSIKTYDTSQIIEAIQETIKILKNFNDIEIRNNVVPYLAISEVKKEGFDKIITGDGADELFAGYNFLINKTTSELELDLRRIAKIMHFPSQKIGNSMGVKVESPFCHHTVMEFAKNLPSQYMIGIREGKKFGKFVLRQAFDGMIPSQIAWRQKSPMQEGAGTQGLTEFFDSMMSDNTFATKIKQIKNKDNIIIRSKESLYYYEVFRKHYEPDISDSASICPDCHHAIEENSRFCRMCGKFPI